MVVTYKDYEWIHNRLDQLNLIDKRRLAVVCHGQVFQQRMEKEFDKRVPPQSYKAGDLVLKRIILPQGDPRGNWTPLMMLTTMDGEDFPLPVNANVVKKYFA